MVISLQRAVVAANIAPTAKQIVLLSLMKHSDQKSQFSFQESSTLSLLTCHSSLSVELALVLHGVEMSFRFPDQPVIVDLPKFVAADSNFFPSAAGSGVRSG